MTGYAFLGAIEQGCVYGLMVLGVYITFRVLDFPDLTVDGSLPLGAAVSAAMVTAGFHPLWSLLAALAAGALAGATTAILATRLKIMSLLASIITMTGLYSINIRVMGRPNITLLNAPTIFDFFEFTGLPRQIVTVILFAIAAMAFKYLLDLFLHTELGLSIRATGDNAQMARSQGINTDRMIIIGVSLSNSLVALSGALVAQSQGFADVGMGIGTIVAGLASIILGESIIGTHTVKQQTWSALVGSVLYRIIIAVALSYNVGFLRLTPSDLNLVTALLVVLCLLVPFMRQKILRGR
ncbi:ABC transporter permease [Thermodesulforhabdus norvegica]|uniref:Putative ABC transport system permease protein n=1 Tax=Thermodesulforhabdus norvegica TaxID=39841 RepID=A0A1I4QU74_9BACT|nr:ABC transporter permease [Thermodesulforhabdus norvegica]SFM43557.1 putative ABC transport system permease protein [Thermodesulforhabdus norvegica]